RPCLCCLHETGAQCATTAFRIHVPSFNVGDWGRLTPFRVVAETDLDKPAESSPKSFHHEGNATLWNSKVGIDVMGILFCCASPQVEPLPEPLSMVCGLDWTDGNGGNPVLHRLFHGRVTGGIGPGGLGRGSYRSPSSRTTDSGSEP